VKRTWPVWVIFCLFLVHSIFLLANVVDIPYWDDWEYFSPSGLSRNFDISYLFSRHNEHLIVLSKLLAWIALVVSNLDFRVLSLVSWTAYVSLVVILLQQFVGSSLYREFPGSIVIFIFFFSMASWENFYWSFQSCFHLAILCWTTGLTQAFKGELNPLRALCIGGFFSLSIFSVAFGVPLVVGAFSVWLFFDLKSGTNRRGALTPTAILKSGVFLAVVGAIYLWAKMSPTTGANSVSLHTMPWQISFWSHFLVLVGRSTGANGILASQSFGIGILGILLGSFYRIWKSTGTQLEANLRFWVAHTSGVLLALSSISVGRAYMGSEQALATRYAEISMLLIPPVIIFGSKLFWIKGPVFQDRLLKVLFALFFCFYLDSWDFMKYARHRADRISGQDCLVKVLNSQYDQVCEYYYPAALKSKMSRAKDLDVSFLRNLNNLNK
jgi:hypothetical protein